MEQFSAAFAGTSMDSITQQFRDLQTPMGHRLRQMTSRISSQLTSSRQQGQQLEQTIASRLSKIEPRADKTDGQISSLQSVMSELTATLPVFVTSKQVSMLDTGIADTGDG